jgi:hypothetical protein
MALYRRDVAAAGRIVDECLRRWPPQRVYLRLFEPALVLSGSLFARGRVGYRDEHFITWHTLRFLRHVRRRFVRPDPDGPLALATGVWQESHLIGLRMVCDFLQHDGWRTDWYASNDRATVRNATDGLRPAAVLLSVGLDVGLPYARRLIGDLRRNGYAGLIAVGGRAVSRDPSIVARLGADLTAANGLELVRRLRARGIGGGRAATVREDGGETG